MKFLKKKRKQKFIITIIKDLIPKTVKQVQKIYISLYKQTQNIKAQFFFITACLEILSPSRSYQHTCLCCL